MKALRGLALAAAGPLIYLCWASREGCRVFASGPRDRFSRRIRWLTWCKPKTTSKFELKRCFACAGFPFERTLLA